jgi:lysozyme
MSDPSIESIMIAHEGMMLRPYCDRCSQDVVSHATGWHCGCTGAGHAVGRMTIGVGHNLDVEGIHEAEALSLLRRDLTECIDDLNTIEELQFAQGARRMALVELRFMCGHTGFREFVRMLACCKERAWDGAADELLASAVYKTAPLRITQMSPMLRYNVVPRALLDAIAARRAS